ncbi:MAG: tetratricopeptide repeat protein [Ktedonobacteraceae bacterium]
MAQTTLRDYLQSTEDAISSGRIDEAFDHCQIMLTNFPESLEAQRLLGEVYLAQGQLADAQQTFDWVLTNDPENVIAYCDRALISERMADYETALDCYQQAYELSRGNSQIRQEFNILSAKVGQQGFIFSRAGLARLYMRGDLLPQAIQEWETVLTASPDRLDARTGLLETYWREGLYDQVQQLARNILNDVPACLKALLLLAHVTFAGNVSASQELLQRAETLDPELTMASELFSDLLANQPHDPFLAVLQKQTSTFSQKPDGQLTAPPVAATQSTSSPTSTNGNGNGSHSTSEFSDSLMRWSSLDNIIEPQQDYPVMQDASPLATWSGNKQSDSNAWNILAEQETSAPQQVQQHTVQQEQNTPVFDSWSMPGQSSDNWPLLETQPVQPAANNDGITANEQPPWFTASTKEPQVAREDEELARWNNANQAVPSDSPTANGETPAEGVHSSPPAWLDMLTRSEQSRQPDESTSTPSTDTSPHVEPSSSAPSAHEPQHETSIVPQQNDEPDYFFGPEWLKSLGATAMDTTDSTDSMDSALPTGAIASVEPATTVEETVPSPEPVEQQPASSMEEATPFDWISAQPTWEEQMLQVNIEQQVPEADYAPKADVSPALEIPPVVPEQKQQISVESWLAQAAQKLSQPDQNLLVTLEELEKDLHSQGFTQLKPGALAAIAQEPTLSSALAQLGDYDQQATISSQSTEQTASILPAETMPAPTASTTPAEPLWAATPEPVARQNPPVTSDVPTMPTANVPSVQETSAASAMPSHLDMLSSFTSQAWPKTPSSPLPAAEPQMPAAEQVAQPAAQVSTPTPALSSAQAATPTMNADALLDMALETTMKRPAVRLQPMQPQRQGISRNNTGERPMSGKPLSGDLTYKERLLKGYQFQLAGAYDNAMQEYRIIIRNAPELLGDIVSNMRALLKLAPKYSAGYRVLGDAYMRQGEYLQAMEAYNKALTMAKKAKS